MTIYVWLLGVPLAMFILYITIRLGASAFYRSKREFAIWYKSYIASERKGESE